MRRLIRFVALVPEKFETIIHKGEVEEETIASKAVTSMPYNLDPSFRVIAIDAGQNLMMGQTVSFLEICTFGGPFPNQSIVFLGR